jgi:hypothetical protein
MTRGSISPALLASLFFVGEGAATAQREVRIGWSGLRPERIFVDRASTQVPFTYDKSSRLFRLPMPGSIGTQHRVVVEYPGRKLMGAAGGPRDRTSFVLRVVPGNDHITFELPYPSESLWCNKTGLMAVSKQQDDAAGALEAVVTASYLLRLRTPYSCQQDGAVHVRNSVRDRLAELTARAKYILTYTIPSQ